MGANADRYAYNARPDKVRFMLRDADAGEQAHGYYTTLLEQVQAVTGWSEDYTKRHVKYQVAEKRRNGKVERTGVILQLTWRACEACFGLGLSWMGRVIEVEMKTYLQEQEPGAYEGFIDAVMNSTGKLNTYIYQNGGRASAKKGRGTKSATLGSKKADKNVKCYKRQGERPGLEAAVRGKTVKSIASTTIEYRDAVPPEQGAAPLWNVFFTRCARVGFMMIAKELTERGIDLGEFFSDFVPEAEEKTAYPVDDTTVILDSGGQHFTAL